MKYFYLLLCMLLSTSISIASPFNFPGTGSIHNDQSAVNSGLSFALNHVPDRHAVVWVNRDSRLSGKIVPLKTYRTSYGQVCREYASLSLTSSGTQQNFGMACRQENGGWQLAGQMSVQGYENRAMVMGKSQAQLCPYSSRRHPPLNNMLKPQPRKQYHSEEFLRQHQRIPKQRMKIPAGTPQLVLN